MDGDAKAFVYVFCGLFLMLTVMTVSGMICDAINLPAKVERMKLEENKRQYEESKKQNITVTTSAPSLVEVEAK